ncbi:MAG TPA: hypothetical protein VJS88_05785, partial [Chthoniobacterales bacterium]|nr:hypothetical protein [Chthoniobacterales bacterium]
MTIPFLSYFKRNKGNGAEKEKAAPVAKAAPAPLEKPSSERFSKTVMPNSARTVAAHDPFEMASRSTALGGQMAGGINLAPAQQQQRTISFSPSSTATPTRDLPPAVALALAPTVERVISLELSDVLAEMPEGYCKPMEVIDTSRRVLLKASEVEKGMATGKPTVSLATVYQQVPEAFIRKIADSDESQLTLPFQKVLDAFAKMQVRRDQERANAVPQVETPFLKVTMEDNEKFGTTIEPIETMELPAVRVEPPTAEAFAAAEPEAAADAIVKMTPPPSSNGHATETTPKRIPFKLSLNGTDAPASESVPASSGPSVPTLPSPLAPVSAAPTPLRIPFKISAPALDEEEAKPKPEPWLTKESMAAASDAPAASEPATPVVSETARVTEVKIALPLLPILKNLPPMQLTSDPGCVPSDVHMELPFSLIEPQLASGRISVTAKVFEVSLPVSFRGLFQAGPGAVDVVLPLQEVLKNLPAASLRMREDQEEQEAGQNFATPFAKTAEEDAKRFKVPAAPVSKPEVTAPVEAKAELAAPDVSPATETLKPAAQDSPREESVRSADVTPASKTAAKPPASTDKAAPAAEAPKPAAIEEEKDG